MTPDPTAPERPVPRKGEVGCSVVAICLLLVLGLVQVVALSGALFPPPPDPDVPNMGLEIIGVYLFGACVLGTAIALLVAASPRGVAPRWLRRIAGVVGAALALGCAAAVLRTCG